MFGKAVYSMLVAKCYFQQFLNVVHIIIIERLSGESVISGLNIMNESIDTVPFTANLNDFYTF